MVKDTKKSAEKPRNAFTMRVDDTFHDKVDRLRALLSKGVLDTPNATEAVKRAVDDMVARLEAKAAKNKLSGPY